MKKMKRILAAGLMLLALAGCGTSDNQAAEYPAMEPLDISKMELAKTARQNISMMRMFGQRRARL